MKSKGLIDDLSFSFKYNSLLNSVDMFVGGEHEDFSKENVSKCTLLNNTLIEKKYWACQLYSLSLINGEKNITTTYEGSVIFHTGIKGIVLPYYSYSFKDNLKEHDCFEEGLGFFSLSYVILCKNYSKLPDLVIEIGDYYYNIGKEMFYNESTKGGDTYYWLNIRFDLLSDLFIIGQPFFSLFHTKFDPENNVLKFYSKDENKIIKSWEKMTKKETPSVHDNTYDDPKIRLLIVLGFIGILVLILCVIDNCCKKKPKPNYMQGVNVNDQVNNDNLIPE